MPKLMLLLLFLLVSASFALARTEVGSQPVTFSGAKLLTVNKGGETQLTPILIQLQSDRLIIEAKDSKQVLQTIPYSDLERAEYRRVKEPRPTKRMAIGAGALIGGFAMFLGAFRFESDQLAVLSVGTMGVGLSMIGASIRRPITHRLSLVTHNQPVLLALSKRNYSRLLSTLATLSHKSVERVP